MLTWWCQHLHGTPIQIFWGRGDGQIADCNRWRSIHTIDHLEYLNDVSIFVVSLNYFWVWIESVTEVVSYNICFLLSVQKQKNQIEQLMNTFRVYFKRYAPKLHSEFLLGRVYFNFLEDWESVSLTVFFFLRKMFQHS